MVTVTPCTVATEVVVTVWTCSSGSLSLISTLPLKAVSGVVFTASSFATVILVLSSTTLITTVAESHAWGVPSSQTIYSKLSSPTKPAGGVYV